MEEQDKKLNHQICRFDVLHAYYYMYDAITSLSFYNRRFSNLKLNLLTNRMLHPFMVLVPEKLVNDSMPT